jgi:hypothetical protein
MAPLILGRDSMHRKITLRVLNVDFEIEQTVLNVANHLADLVWSVVDSRASATVIVDQSEDLVCHAIEAARRIEHSLVGARVDRVDEELVGIPDIAARVKLNRETVRSWASGTRGPGDFPSPVGSVGGGDRGAAKIWRWADINAWLDRRYSLGDGYSYATDAEFAEVSAYLARANYIVVANVQNGPPVLPAFSFSLASQGTHTLTVTSTAPNEVNYMTAARRSGV